MDSVVHRAIDACGGGQSALFQEFPCDDHRDHYPFRRSHEPRSGSLSLLSNPVAASSMIIDATHVLSVIHISAVAKRCVELIFIILQSTYTFLLASLGRSI